MKKREDGLFEIDGCLFDWDENKHKINISKHGISFREAATVFSDENAIELEDDEHSNTKKDFWLSVEVTDFV